MGFALASPTHWDRAGEGSLCAALAALQHGSKACACCGLQRAAARVQVDPWWDQHWVGAQNATSNIVRSAFRHIQQAHPYWNRSNGADHFLVYSYDRGTVLSYKGLLLLVQALGPRSGCKLCTSTIKV